MYDDVFTAWNANIGFITHFGAGIFLFVGAGAAIVSGAAFSANVGVGRSKRIRMAVK